MPIGISQDFEYQELCLKLKPGDRFYLYSDGVTEARNAKKEMFGEEELTKYLKGADDEPIADSVNEIGRRVDAWCRPGAPEDDVTVLACEITPCRP